MTENLLLQHPHIPTVTPVQKQEASRVESGVNVTQDAAQRLSISCSAHGRKGNGLRLVLCGVEVTLLEMVRHAGEIIETP